MNKSEIEKITKLLKGASSISQLELPVLLLGVLALIPGVLDEAVFGVGAIAIFAVIALGRRYLINHRKEYKFALEKALLDNNLSQSEYNDAIRDLNTLTIEGGSKS